MTAPVRLPADRVHAWRMERQLLGRERASSPAEVGRVFDQRGPKLEIGPDDA